MVWRLIPIAGTLAFAFMQAFDGQVSSERAVTSIAASTTTRSYTIAGILLTDRQARCIRILGGPLRRNFPQAVTAGSKGLLTLRGGGFGKGCSA